MKKGIIVACLSGILLIGGVTCVLGQPTPTPPPHIISPFPYPPFPLPTIFPTIFPNLTTVHQIPQKIDANKRGNNDDKMCWAAAAANMLRAKGWWTTDNEQQIYDTFTSTQNWENNGGLMKYAWQWWFNGNVPQWLYKDCQGPGCKKCPGEWAQVERGSGNHLKRSDFPQNYYYCGQFDQQEAMANLYDLVNESNYGVTIAIYDKSLITGKFASGHALSVWDAKEVNQDEFRLTITDSDDDQSKKHSYFINFKYDDSKGWHIVGNEQYQDWQVEGVHALNSFALPVTKPMSPDVPFPQYCATGDKPLAIVRDQCLDIDVTGTEQEISCDDNNEKVVIQNGEYLIPPTKRTKFSVPFTPGTPLVIQITFDANREEILGQNKVHQLERWETNAQDYQESFTLTARDSEKLQQLDDPNISRILQVLAQEDLIGRTITGTKKDFIELIKFLLPKADITDEEEITRYVNILLNYTVYTIIIENPTEDFCLRPVIGSSGCDRSQ
ncbi:hypothetical protein U27_06127 [Candidatus Vecturithrix granuli]|uniref:Uncharacterized protein n=1 Tax=Vecturithrix granuli TaxID=1499967 RepID=A0A081C3J6_VECG1|nr:hypothetical protein U27_06127 [Candidatus Vecturithrix granuli]